MIQKDPICGMTVDPATAKYKTKRDGVEVFFCSQHCKIKFEKNSEPNITHEMPMAQAAATEWTCPMHPEVVQDHPGNCPKCGMTLEPKGASLSEDLTEYHDMKKRCMFGAILTVPLVFLAMGDLLPGQPVSKLFSHEFIRWTELILGTPVVLWGGWPFFVRGWQSLVNRSLNMFTLIGLGVGVAYVYSVIATLFPNLFPDSFREMGKVSTYYEAAGVIVTLILLGQVLELKARSQTNSAIKKLLGLSPKQLV